MSRTRGKLEAFREKHGPGDKPVWMTETGSTSSPALTIRTDYPDSPQPQAAGTAKPALYSFRLLPHELVPFESAIPLQTDPRSDTTIDEIDRRRR